MPLSYIDLLKRTLSPERFGAYRSHVNADDEAVALMVWDALLAEAAHVSLRHLEITLRNGLDRAVTRKHGPDWLDDPAVVVNLRGRDAIQAGRNEVAEGDRRHPPPPSSSHRGRLMAALRFSFWTTLLGPEYATGPTTTKPLWPDLLPSVFPFAPKGTRRAEAQLRFRIIRLFRNRVAHHDPIWLGRPSGATGGQATLLKQHDEVLEALGWMSPEVLELVGPVDRLAAVEAGGWQEVLVELRSVGLPR